MRLIIILAMLATLSACMTAEEVKLSAISNARAYAAEAGLDVSGVTCTNLDTDQNGMVGCTLHFKDGSKRQLECAHDVVFAPLGQPSGCKDVVYSAIGQTNN